jgi:hypothetical protein
MEILNISITIVRKNRNDEKPDRREGLLIPKEIKDNHPWMYLKKDGVIQWVK